MPKEFNTTKITYNQHVTYFEIFMHFVVLAQYFKCDMLIVNQLQIVCYLSQCIL